jgi:hypothetical protein
VTDWYQPVQELLSEFRLINVIVRMQTKASVFGPCTEQVYGKMVKAQIVGIKLGNILPIHNIFPFSF